MQPQAHPAQAPERCDGGDFSGQCLDDTNLSGRVISRAKFDGASLKRANLSRAEFLDCSFVGACLDGATMNHTMFENCDFAQASVVKASLQKAVFRATTVLGYGKKETTLRHAKTNFDGATLDGSSFAGARLIAATLHNVKANGVDFSNCDLRNSSFNGSTLDAVKFSGAKLQDANFATCPDARNLLPLYAQMLAKFIQPISEAQLKACLEAHLKWLATHGAEGMRLCLQGFDLSGQKLDGYDFSGTDFRGARLDRASMKNVKLVAADLRNASMIGTNFTASDLRGALLSDKALRRAILTGALVHELAPI